MMGGLRGGAATALAAALVAAAASERVIAQATPPSQTRDRGVLVLRPTPTPSSTTTPAPVATVAPVPAPAPTPVAARACARPFARPTLSLGRATGFEARLAAALKRRNGSVVVDVARPFALGTAAPAPLQPWITEVKATGGQVTVDQYCEGARGFFSFLKKVFGGPQASRYAAADGYDAVLHADGRDQIVTQVEFRWRAAR